MQARMTGILLGALALLCGACSFSFAQNDPQALTMDEAVRMALSGNLTLQTARADAAAANARIGSARSAELPSIAALGVFSNSDAVIIPSSAPAVIPGGQGSSRHSMAVGMVAARLNVYTGGRVHALVSKNEALYDVAVARLGTAETQVSFLTRQAYHSVLLSESLVLTGEKGLDAAEAQFELAKSRFDAGTTARFDVLRAQTQLSEAEQNLIQAKNQVQTARMALNRLLGAPLDKQYKLSAPVQPEAQTEDIAALVSLADGQRSEILAARAQLEAAGTGIKLARSENLPQLELMTAYQVLKENSPLQSSGPILSAMLTVPLFGGGKTHSDAQEARAIVDTARANLDDTRRMVEQEVRQSWLDLQATESIQKTAQSRLALAEEAHDIAVVRYKAGVSTAVEVADAIASLTAARTNMDKAASGHGIAYAALQRALGRSVY